MKQKSINNLLTDPEQKEELKQRLNFVKAIREFSVIELGLPDNNSYLSYADLERRFVVWTIYATPRFSLKPKNWCYLVVGCLSYKGYFAEADAKKEMVKLRQEGLDVYMGGVVAYSTLGWFADPVLNTMLNWSDIELAKVIFHELTHQLLYINNDTVFNESFAETIAIIGVRKWLDKKGDMHLIDQFEEQRDTQKLFIELVFKYKHRLEKLFQSELPVVVMESEKAVIFNAMKSEYEQAKINWQTDDYDNWFNTALNNAKLASVLTYHQFVDDMLAIYAKS
ncbi:MAG: aminopeptidase, partial [Pseudomonadota bacterium]